MYPQLLEALRCPACRSGRLALAADARRDGAELVGGELVCEHDGARYPIRNGVLDLLGWSPPTSPAQLVNNLPPVAWAYERIWRFRALSLLTGEPFPYARELRLVSELLAPQRPGLYVDLACSTGLYARALAQARGASPGHVVGVDHALPMLYEARSFARRAGLRISFVRAKAQQLPFANGAAAGLAIGGSLNEIGAIDGCLAESRRLLATQGRCVIMSLVRAAALPGRALQALLASGGVVFPPLDELNQRLRAAGLRLAAQWRYRVVVFSQLLPGAEAVLTTETQRRRELL
jgi:SAM-dependent methyltransferase/uncharacterized protein YbaR (Trm112 family)